VVNGILIPPSQRRSTRRWMVELRSLSSCGNESWQDRKFHRNKHLEHTSQYVLNDFSEAAPHKHSIIMSS